MNCQLTERRAADRRAMATQLHQLATDRNAQVTLRQEDREIKVTIETPQGAAVTFTLDGRASQPDLFVLSWYFNLNANRRFSPDHFGSSRVNQFHGRKATDVAQGFIELCSLLDRRLAAAQSGEMFTAAASADATRPPAPTFVIRDIARHTRVEGGKKETTETVTERSYDSLDADGLEAFDRARLAAMLELDMTDYQVGSTRYTIRYPQAEPASA